MSHGGMGEDDAGGVERELKLAPADVSLLDRLAGLDRLGPFIVTGRREERQRNSFFDTRGRALEAAHVGFRRRATDGRRLATWTLKAGGQVLGGVATRPEVEVQLEAETPPVLALQVLLAAARQRGAAALAEQVADALATADRPPLGAPVIETFTHRVLRDLESAERGWRAELALDRVRLLGHAYAETEIEVELHQGDLAALEAAREAIAALGEARASEGSKLSRALDHARACTCAARGA